MGTLINFKTNVWRWMGLNNDFDAISNRYGHLIVSDGLPKYHGLTDNVNMYTLSTAIGGFALAAANTSQTAATFQPVVGFINPAGSGVDAVLIEATYGIVSGAASAANEGYPFWQITTTSTPASTSIGSATVTNHRTLSQSAASGQKVIASTNSAFTGNGSTWITLKPFVGSGNAGPRTAAPTASINYNGLSKETLDGLIKVPSGVGVGIAAQGAGTNITVAGSLTWIEIPSM